MRRNADTSLRMFLQIQHEQKKSQQYGSIYTPFRIMCTQAALLELVFYLPNRFRKVVIMNAQTVSFAESESALLSLMTIMFNLKEDQAMEFRLKQFLGSYKLFFVSTLPYEALSLPLRMKIFEQLTENKGFMFSGAHSDLATGFIVGAVVQYVTNPLLKLSIANHNEKISQKETFQSFLKEAYTQSNQRGLSFLFQIPLSLIFRGGMIGMIQQGVYTKMIKFNEESPIAQANQQKPLNERTSNFLEQVSNQNELVLRLQKSGYFDSTNDLSVNEGIKSYRSILISSLVSSVILSTVMTPLDLIVFSQIQARLYGKTAAQKNAKFLQVGRELMKNQGIGSISVMTFASSLVRNFFIMTGVYGLDNYQRNLRFNE